MPHSAQHTMYYLFKQLRQKQVRKERYEEEMEMTAEQTKMVDNCQARIQKEELNKKEVLNITV